MAEPPWPAADFAGAGFFAGFGFSDFCLPGFFDSDFLVSDLVVSDFVVSDLVSDVFVSDLVVSGLVSSDFWLSDFAGEAGVAGVAGVVLIMGVRLQHGLSVPGLILCGFGVVALTLATLAAACLSLVLEALQTYLPLRVASNVDFGLNAAGGLAGAVAAWVLERVGAIDRWRRLRARWFVRNSRGALVLLALWPLGLLFPPPVAFGMGQVFARAEDWLAELLADTPFLTWLPARDLALQPLLPGEEVLAVALGALVPCLLGYTVIRHKGRRLLFAAMAWRWPLAPRPAAR